MACLGASLADETAYITSLSVQVLNNWSSAANGHRALYFSAGNVCRRFYGLKLQILETLNLRKPTRKHRPIDEFKSQEKDELPEHSKVAPTAERAPIVNLSNG